MNDLHLVRGVYDDPPPPSDQATEAARARMLGQDDTARPRSRRAWRLPVGLLAAATAAATAAAVVAGVTLTTDAPPPRTGVQAVPDDARSPRGMMLAAASQAERQRQGPYWYSHQRTAFATLARGRTGGYVVEERHEYFMWTGRARGDGNSFYGRTFAGGPQTGADADAWRAAGSPSSWTVRSSGVTRTVSATSGAWQEDDPDDQGGGVFHIPGLGQFTYQELQELPTDSAGLYELLCEGSVRFLGGGSGAPKRCDKSKKVLDQAFSVLTGTPVPPKVRAGLMRLITDYPGVRRLGAVTDPLGRPAVGLAASFETADGRGTLQEEVLFDQRTGKVLGRRHVQLEPGPNSEKWQVPGRTLDSWLIMDSGWSDAKPALPG
ncbi:CU044_5270 family protein [Nonomuraea sp. NPDC049504]|uniref:CU044_5270 family protein n=1 Tax=Nonomuraea sp. NPDC049504 TaxID=3154729 RepID=UPI00343C015D